MKQISKAKNDLTAFAKDTAGSFAVMTIFIIMGVMLVAGATVDYSRIARTQTNVTASLDAAILATGNDLLNDETDQAQLRAIFEAMFLTNLESKGATGTVYRITSFDADIETGKISATVEADVEMSLMKIGGHDIKTIPVSGEATFAQQETEVVMVLDVTGSMRGSKLASLKTAAASAINILLPEPNSTSVRVGLVPYSASVNIGDYKNAVLAQRVEIASLDGTLTVDSTHLSADLSDGCVTERIGRDMATDASYEVSRIGSDDRAEGLCPNAEITPLTNNANTLTGELNQLNAAGGTAGHLGIAWSYYMLSENWRDLWPTSADPEPYASDVNKIAILMTDGSFNTSYTGIPSSQIANSLCNDMKLPKSGNSGITVYSIAFNAPASAQQVLRNCATPDNGGETYYYAPQSGNELEQTFRDIAKSIQTLRLSK